MIEVETQTTEVEVINNVEVTSTSQVEVETVELSDLDITVAKKEYVITGDDIYIPMLYDDAPQWMKDLVQLVVDVSISSGNQSLINNMNAILQDFAVSYVPLNQYTQSILDLGDEDTRLNVLIETLNSNFNDGLSTANAQIIEMQLTKASKDEVVAQVIQTIAAQLADGTSNIGSTIGRIDQAIADETSARALSLQTLTASLEDTNLDVAANAEVIQNALAYVGIDEAGASTGTGLSAYLEDSNGNIGGADSQLANSIRVTAEKVESKFAYNSIVNINGVYKKSGFGLTTNYVSGNGTQANPYVSEFWIDASRFKFTNSNVTGSVAPFTIDASGLTPQIEFNGRVSFGNIYDQTIIQNGYINTGLIQANTINANQINTVGLIAENISANELVGKTLTGTVINGARINGSVIKASYLDLDGELEVLTNYHITPTMYNANPSLYTDAIYISADNEYRIPSISTISSFGSSTILSGAYNGVTNYTKSSGLYSYLTANVGHNRKSVKLQPTIQFDFSNRDGSNLYHGMSSNTATNYFRIYLGSTLLLQVAHIFSAYTITATVSGLVSLTFSHTTNNSSTTRTVSFGGISFNISLGITTVFESTNYYCIVNPTSDNMNMIGIDFSSGQIYFSATNSSTIYGGNALVRFTSPNIIINNMI